MNRIDAAFADLRARGRRGLMPFLCAGHPAPGMTGPLLRALSDSGASVIEVGFPFSDPIADGPVIAAAMYKALGGGVGGARTTPASVLAEVAAVRDSVAAGLVAMVTISIVMRIGPERFIKDCADAGFDGFIFPDLPLEESNRVLGLVRDAGLRASLLIAPTTAPERAAKIARASSGFVYLLAREGITGERAGGPSGDLGIRVAALRNVTDLPIACGFGISTPEQVRTVVQHADAAIVGSALVRRLEEAAARGGDVPAEAAAFTRSLAAAC
jgi:tryptophan synthase alpha chain